MKFRNISLLVTLISAALINAQENENSTYKYFNNFDLSVAAGSQFAGAASWSHFHKVTKKGRFKIGYGARITAQTGNKIYYSTAPAELTSKQTGPQVLFSKTYYENIDTFYVSHAQNNFINAFVDLQYTFKDKFDIGFNIDAIGVTFGNKVNGKYISHQSSLSNSVHEAKPTALNALLVSDNDLGSLNSELYFRYWFKSNMAIKTGASFIFTEYTTNNRLRLDNNRWRSKTLLFMAGFTFTPFIYKAK